MKTSDRLVGSPALATNADKFMSSQMRRMMKAMKKPGEAEETVKVNLEINPRHTVIKKLAGLRTTNADKAELVAEQLLDNALIAAGLMEDPSRMIARLNKLLESI